MGPTWGPSGPNTSQLGPMNFAIRDAMSSACWVYLGMFVHITSAGNQLEYIHIYIFAIDIMKVCMNPMTYIVIFPSDIKYQAFSFPLNSTFFLVLAYIVNDIPVTKELGNNSITNISMYAAWCCPMHTWHSQSSIANPFVEIRWL